MRAHTKSRDSHHTMITKRDELVAQYTSVFRTSKIILTVASCRDYHKIVPLKCLHGCCSVYTRTCKVWKDWIWMGSGAGILACFHPMTLSSRNKLAQVSVLPHKECTRICLRFDRVLQLHNSTVAASNWEHSRTLPRHVNPPQR
jgi:hypothetical protein